MSESGHRWKPNSAADLPQRIALFPLPAALLLPRAQLPLHVFEPRYLAMINAALMTPERLIGMIAPIGTSDLDPQPQDSRLSMIGCAGRITRFHEIEDGRMMLSLTGISRFRLHEEVASDRPWRQAEIIWDGFERDLGAAETDPSLDRPAFFGQVSRYLALKRLTIDLKALEGASDEDVINVLCAICPFEADDKQALLEAPSLQTRRQSLAALMEFSLLGGDNNGTMQ